MILAIKRFIILFLVTMFVSSLMPDFEKNDSVDSFNATIFNVSGIMFSLGLGLLATFNLNSVKNKSYINEIRKRLNTVRNIFIFCFVITIICYSLDNFFGKISFCPIPDIEKLQIKINFTILYCFSAFYSILYYIRNFFAMQKLNDDILDKVLKEDNDD